MCSQIILRLPVHEIRVKGIFVPQCPGLPKRITQRRIQDQIAVLLSLAAVPGVKIIRHLLTVKRGNIGGKLGIQRQWKPVARDHALRAEAHTEFIGVYAAVCAAASDHRHILL